VTYHSITCSYGCNGDWCDCGCHESDARSTGTDTIGAQDNSGPRPAFAPPTEGLTTTTNQES
jgi:hypothetical protein